MTEKTLREQLKAHDWYACMSDDPSVWRRGDANWNRLKAMLDERGYDWSLGGPDSLRKAVSGMIFEDMTRHPDKDRHGRVVYYKEAWRSKFTGDFRHVALPAEEELIKREKAEKILKWLDEHP